MTDKKPIGIDQMVDGVLADLRSNDQRQTTALQQSFDVLASHLAGSRYLAEIKMPAGDYYGQMYFEVGDSCLKVQCERKLYRMHYSFHSSDSIHVGVSWIDYGTVTGPLEACEKIAMWMGTKLYELEGAG